MRFSRWLLMLVLVSSSCVTALQEAAPLEIKRTPEKRTPPPLVIQRATLNDVLSRGPGRFFAQMPVTPHRIRGHFVGFRLMALYRHHPPSPNGVQVGDVVTAVNGVAIKRPNHFMEVWKGLKKARALRVNLLRDNQPLFITYQIIE